VNDLLMRFATAIGDRYAVELEIGSGGMATVFLAEDRKHHRKVAIKVLHPELAKAIGPDRFLREIDSVACLNHPHVLPLYDSGEANGLLYFIMPYVEGESLEQRLAREKQLPIEAAIRIAVQVADALDYAHRRGLIHRDIKPANILLEDEHAVISDFGVARAISGNGSQQSTATGLTVGTPAYMSPEQAGGDDVDGRSDLYALGCVLYEMLSGEPPLTGPTPQATVALRLTRTATPLPVLRDTVPDWLDRAVTKLLAKSPADRFQTANELLEALKAPDRPLEGRSRLASRILTWGVTTVFAVLAASVFATQWINAGRSGSSQAVDPRRVAVMKFENRTGDASLEGLGEDVAEQITSRLHRERAGEVVPRSLVSGVISSRGIDKVRAVAAATGAALVISGSFAEFGDSLGFAIQIVDGVSGTLKGSFALAGLSTDVPGEVMDILTSRVAGGLLLAFNGAYPAWSLTTFPTVAAWRLHEQGSDLSTVRRYRDALRLYLAAWAQDSTFWLALYSAVAAYHGLGAIAAADSLSRVLEERYRPAMNGVQRYEFDATRAWFERDVETAIHLQRRVVGLLPESWVLRHQLAFYCRKTNRWREVVETMMEAEAHLPRDPASALEHLRILADAHHVLGEHEVELQVARRIDRLGMGSPLDRTYLRARALAALGETDSVLRLLDRMESMSDSTPLAGQVMLAVALELRAHQGRETAGPAFRRTIRWFEDRPERLRHDRAHAVAYGAALYHAESWIASDSVLGGVTESGNSEIDVIGYRGLLAARRNDEKLADLHAVELERIGRENYDVRPQSWAYRARISAVLGEPVRAVSQLKRAFDESLDYGPTYLLEQQYRFDFEAMADYAPYQELLQPKG